MCGLDFGVVVRTARVQSFGARAGVAARAVPLALLVVGCGFGELEEPLEGHRHTADVVIDHRPQTAVGDEVVLVGP